MLIWGHARPLSSNWKAFLMPQSHSQKINGGRGVVSEEQVFGVIIKNLMYAVFFSSQSWKLFQLIFRPVVGTDLKGLFLPQ